MCATAWKEEQVREYASLVAAVLAICFLKDSGRPLFRNSLRALNCSSSWEFSEASRLLSSKMEMTAEALRAFFSGPPEEPLEPATVTVYGQRRHLSCMCGERLVTRNSPGLLTGRFSQNIVQAAERFLGVCLLRRHLFLEANN